jgi:hypothetical protein
MAAPATVIHTVGSKVWVPDPAESWIKAEVQKIEEGKDGAGVLIVALEESGELRKVPASDAPLQNVETRGVEVRPALVLARRHLMRRVVLAAAMISLSADRRLGRAGSAGSAEQLLPLSRTNTSDAASLPSSCWQPQLCRAVVAAANDAAAAGRAWTSLIALLGCRYCCACISAA